jgi:hypothetical protein
MWSAPKVARKFCFSEYLYQENCQWQNNPTVQGGVPMTVKEMEKPVGLHLTPAFLLSYNVSYGK